MIALFIFFAIVAVIVAIAKATNPHENANNNESTIIDVIMLNTEPEYNDYKFNTFISGVTHHAKKDDVGPFIGIVAPEPTNQYDKKAMAIYNIEGRLLGYIGKQDLNSYREWSDCKPCHCVGYIQNDDDTYNGRINAIRPYNMDFVKEEIGSYLRWYKNKYGSENISLELKEQFEL